MPKVNNTPEKLRPYVFHGVNLEWSDSSTQAEGDCPFCGKPKFSVNIETGKYRCWSCATGNSKGGGNISVFMQKLYEKAVAFTHQTEFGDFVRNRQLLRPETAVEFGMARSPMTHDWLMPGYNTDGKMIQLYRYVTVGNKRRLLPTPTLGHKLHFPEWMITKKFTTIYVCEGPWDAMALYEVLRMSKQTDDGLKHTGNVDSSLLADSLVIAVPGCQVWSAEWSELTAGKNVVLMYDNDHPNNGVESVGYTAMQRVIKLLKDTAPEPASIKYLAWGGPGKTHDPALPSGTDVRDYLTGLPGTPLEPVGSRITRLNQLLGLLVDSDINGPRNEKKAKNAEVGRAVRDGYSDSTKPCTSYRDLIAAWRKALKWTDGLDRALSVMLASVASVRTIGDQLWVKIIGPAACGKSTLCEAISSASRYVLAKSTIRGFHSGFKVERGNDDEDNSLVHLCRNKTLVTKDGDTLLQSPNLPQILSEARDLYDCVARTHYRNKASKDYEGVRMTWILCGTSSLRTIDQSELGERFLDCVIMEKIDDDLEDEILLRVAHRADRCMSIEANGSAASQQDPDMANAIAMTGGYIEWLVPKAAKLLSQIDMSDEVKHMCVRLGKFVAHMRARPSLKQDESHEREFASRLVIQHVRLAKCLALVLNKQEVDDEAMRRVRAVAMDTARGQTMKIVDHLAKVGQSGSEVRAVSASVANLDDKVGKLLRFLRHIGVVESFTIKSKTGFRQSSPRYRLTQRMLLLRRDAIAEVQKSAE